MSILFIGFNVASSILKGNHMKIGTRFLNAKLKVETNKFLLVKICVNRSWQFVAKYTVRRIPILS